MAFSSGVEKSQQFCEELYGLLQKYQAELYIDTDKFTKLPSMRVEFLFDQELYDTTANGIAPEIDIGSWTNGYSYRVWSSE